MHAVFDRFVMRYRYATDIFPARLGYVSPLRVYCCFDFLVFVDTNDY